MIRSRHVATAAIVSGMNATLAEMEASFERVFSSRSCRICGCTDGRACFDWSSGTPCYWAEPDLCSACLGAAARQDKARQEKQP